MISQAITVSRKQLYDEIWELSASGVAKKYGVPYSLFLQQVKLSGVPIPPSGYWTKIRFGKPVEIIPLSGDPEELVTFEAMPSSKAGRKRPLRAQRSKHKSAEEAEENATGKATEARPEIAEEQSLLPSPSEVETIDYYGQTYNVYDRETLYREVWQAPVIDVATRYKVSDTTIRKICRALDIPLPKQGYWAKLRAGKPVEKRPPLPKTGKDAKRIGPQTGFTWHPKQRQSKEDILAFLDEEERTILMTVAAQFRIPDESERMHPKIVAHRKAIAEWKKEHQNRAATGGRPWHASQKPFLADGISEASIPRACHILDALAKTVEPLGGKLENDLTFIVNNETIRIKFSEAKDTVPHVLTKEEHRKLLEYQEERKRHQYVSQPQIPKYDHPYNGRLTLDISQGKSFRDGSTPLEERLGEILLELYVAAEKAKQDRLKQEEAERQRLEEQRKREERRKRHDLEVSKTLALRNAAEDYDVACKIRQYISAYLAAHPDKDLTDWAQWAAAKADWYDPTISREDEFLGVRDHAQDADKKEPKRYGWY